MAGEITSRTSSSFLPLDGRVAIITGASGDLGRAISMHLFSLGAKVGLNYASDSAKSDLLASQLNSSAPSSHLRAVSVKADISCPDQVKFLFDKAELEFGFVDILVYSAAVMDPKYPTLGSTTLEDWDTTFNVNTEGAFLCCREAANRLTRKGSGRIIMITSANCVAPGPVATELFFSGKTEETIKRTMDACPLGRLGEPKDIVQVVGFIASDDGGWINGQIIGVNGGFCV